MQSAGRTSHNVATALHTNQIPISVKQIQRQPGMLSILEWSLASASFSLALKVLPSSVKRSFSAQMVGHAVLQLCKSGWCGCVKTFILRCGLVFLPFSKWPTEQNQWRKSMNKINEHLQQIKTNPTCWMTPCTKPSAEQGQVAPSMDPWKSGRSDLALQLLKTSKLGFWCSVKPTSLPSHSAHHFPLKRWNSCHLSSHLSSHLSCHLSWNASSSKWMLCQGRKPIQLMPMKNGALKTAIQRLYLEISSP